MSQLELLDELRTLALPDDSPEIRGDELSISRHAIQRYQQRVEALCRRRAQRQLQRLVLDAHWYPLPRPWTQIVIHPGSHYGYSPRRPDVCIVERGAVVRTVLSREVVWNQIEPADRFLEQRVDRRPARRSREAVGGSHTVATHL